MESSLITFSPFSSDPPQIKHHVYLSFRKDTRYNFTSHLEKALRDKQIKTYIDEQLNIGVQIASSLLRAIEESKISIIVFSKGYASSGWCLEELVKILECGENYGQIVIPVFYGVDPSDVRHQTGCYADAFAKHLFEQSSDRVKRWRDFLAKASRIGGFDSRHIRPDSVLIDNIVDDVLKKLNRDLVGNWLNRGDVRSATSLITSSSSFSSNPPQIKHHVFLSFRGEDTRYNFTSHLEKALRDKQIKTYIDDQLIRGDEISPSLLKAIEESQISVIVFSEGYASSGWCLEELVKILECRVMKEHMVIPVFYGVHPVDVSRQTGCYAEAFDSHVQRFTQDKVQRWRYALNEAGNIAGFESSLIKHESVLVDKIVHAVLDKLNNKSPSYDNMLRFKMGITNWVKGKLLGSGSFGSVYEGYSDEGFFFAVKEVSLLDQGRQEELLDPLEQEIAFLSQFEHENIVRYYGTYKDESKLHIFLELVTKGSLLDLYKSYHLTDSQVSAYTRQILHGLKYLHDRDVVHRDIKCANILVDASGSVKIADFGLAKATKFNDVKSSKGTAFWMAPEVVNCKLKDQGYGISADIWSLGCTVLEMLTRQIPYSPLEYQQAFCKIMMGVLPPIPGHLSKDAREFILKCLQTNPSDRPTAAQLLDHAFVKRPDHHHLVWVKEN